MSEIDTSDDAVEARAEVCVAIHGDMTSAALLRALLRERNEARVAHKNASEYAMTGNEALRRALDLADVLFETLYRVTPAARTDEDYQRSLQPAIESRRLLGFLARDPEHLSAMIAASPYAPPTGVEASHTESG